MKFGLSVRLGYIMGSALKISPGQNILRFNGSDELPGHLWLNFMAQSFYYDLDHIEYERGGKQSQLMRNCRFSYFFLVP